MACLNEFTLQQYLEDVAPSPFSKTVEHRLANCARCRATFDRVVTRNRRVNVWLSRLSPPADAVAADASVGLARIRRRIDNQHHLPPMFASSSELWGGSTNPGALASSALVQTSIVAILLLAGTTHIVRKPPTEITLLAPPPLVKPTEHRTGQRGGGGQHSPLPTLKGQLPRPATKVFVPPAITTAHPALVMDASLLAPADAWNAPASAIGDPLGIFGGTAGRGKGGGLGDGDGSGIGDNAGSGTRDGETGIFGVGNGVSRPEVISKADPEYSEEARKAKYSGSVILSIVVNTDGRAANIKVVKSLGMGLDEKAIEAVRRWLFRPGMNNGVPVRVRAQIEINFRLL
jgi:TonB family protein